MGAPPRLRVAALQYFIRPVASFDQFSDQVEGLVATAKDNRCRLLVFPEYFTAQLLTLGDVKRPIHEQVRDLAAHAPRFLDLMSGLARRHGLYIVGGTIPVEVDGALRNRCHVITPAGGVRAQGKLHMTRFEAEEWKVSAESGLRVFESDFGRLAVAICYDVEFPEVARAAARHEAYILVVPSCTDDRQAFLRVRYCAHARAIENHMFVIHAATVGSLPMVPAVSLNYGQASILTPSDFPFARDGILAEGTPNQEAMVIGELDLATIEESRASGSVLPLRDSVTTAEMIAQTEVVRL